MLNERGLYRAGREIPYRYAPGDGSRFTGGFSVPEIGAERLDLTKPCLWWFDMDVYRAFRPYNDSGYRSNCGYVMTNMMVFCPNCKRRIFDISMAMSYPNLFGWHKGQ